MELFESKLVQNLIIILHVIVKMTALTFYNYITNNETENTKRFRELFKSDIGHLPNKVASSIIIRKHLNINTSEKERMFQAAFMEYFKEKIYISL